MNLKSLNVLLSTNELIVSYLVFFWEEGACGLVANMLDCAIFVSKFKIQS